MANENQGTAPNPGTKDALKAELEALKAEQVAKDAELEALRARLALAESDAEAKVNTDAPKEEKRVKVFVPRGASNEEPNLFISVNGVSYLLPKGKESEVPAHIAAEYARMKRAQERRDRNKAQMLDASK